MQIGERIQIVRKGHDLSQEIFAKQLSVTRNMVAKYENGLVYPSDLFINHLCVKFGVSKTWLTTGEGEMYSATTEDDFFSEVIGEIITLENKLINEIIIRLTKLDDDYLKMLHQLVDSMHEKQLKK